MATYQGYSEIVALLACHPTTDLQAKDRWGARAVDTATKRWHEAGNNLDRQKFYSCKIILENAMKQPDARKSESCINILQQTTPEKK